MDDNLLTQLIPLRLAMLSVANADTARDSRGHKARISRSGLAGHGACASYVVQHKFGGEIVGGAIGGSMHYWNRLSDGTEIDLTRDQFGGDGINPIGEGRKVPDRKLTHPEFTKFFNRVEQALSE